MVVPGLDQDPAQRLPHVRVPIRYHDSVACVLLSLSEHAFSVCSQNLRAVWPCLWGKQGLYSVVDEHICGASPHDGRGRRMTGPNGKQPAPLDLLDEAPLSRRSVPRQGQARRRAPAVPSAPLACTICDNRDFVGGVLGDLGHALREAREYHTRIQEMSSQVLTAHEAERKRIARELHDDTAQALTSILVRLRLLERTAGDAEILNNVEELRELTLSALDSVRRMAMDLRPAALDDLGLVPALQAYAERFSETWPTKVIVRVTDGLRRRLPPDVELVLYRVVQEALTNVAKHSAASLARVSLSRRRNEVTLGIEDNGVGFEPADKTQSNGTGLGLFGMRERLALVGGDAQIDSVKGQGTTITAHVPIANKPGKTRRTI